MKRILSALLALCLMVTLAFGTSAVAVTQTGAPAASCNCITLPARPSAS